MAISSSRVSVSWQVTTCLVMTSSTELVRHSGPCAAKARMMSRSEMIPATSPCGSTTTMAPIRFAESLVAISSNVAPRAAVVTARPFCRRMAATCMASSSPPLRQRANSLASQFPEFRYFLLRRNLSACCQLATVCHKLWATSWSRARDLFRARSIAILQLVELRLTVEEAIAQQSCVEAADMGLPGDARRIGQASRAPRQQHIEDRPTADSQQNALIAQRLGEAQQRCGMEWLAHTHGLGTAKAGEEKAHGCAHEAGDGARRTHHQRQDPAINQDVEQGPGDAANGKKDDEPQSIRAARQRTAEGQKPRHVDQEMHGVAMHEEVSEKGGDGRRLAAWQLHRNPAHQAHRNERQRRRQPGILVGRQQPAHDMD